MERSDIRHIPFSLEALQMDQRSTTEGHDGKGPFESRPGRHLHASFPSSSLHPFSSTLSPHNPVTIGPAFCSSFHNILIRFPAPSLPHDLATCTLGFLPFATAAIAECDVEYECKENIKYEVQLDCVLQGI